MPTRFLWDNEWDTGTVTASGSDERANFPATNTQHRWWQKTYRSLTAAACGIVNDLGSNLSINVVALKYTNFTAGADIHLWGADESTFTPIDFNQAISTISQDVMIQYFSATQTLYQYWLLSITDAAVPDGYHELGRVFLGTYWSPGRDFRIGGGRRNRIDTSLMTTGEQGHIASVILGKRNVYEYVFPCLSASDLTQFIAIYDALGMSRGFFFTEDSTAPATTTYYVRFAAPLGIQQEENGLYTVSVSLVESM